MKVTPFTRDLLKAYREEKAKQKQAEADVKVQAEKVIETAN